MRKNNFYAWSLLANDRKSLVVSGQTAEPKVRERIREKIRNMLNNIIRKSKMRLFCRLKFCEIGAFLYIFI